MPYAYPATGVAGSYTVAGGREGREGGFEEPGVEEVVELFAADLFGEGDEILRGGVAVVEAGGPGAQDGEEGVVAEGETERVEGQGAALVDDGWGEERGWAGVAGAGGRAGEDVWRDPEQGQLC